MGGRTGTDFIKHDVYSAIFLLLYSSREKLIGLKIKKKKKVSSSDLSDEF